MRKIFIFGLALLGFASCNDDLTDLNQDTRNPQEVPAGALFANATVELFDFMTSTNVNENNFRLWAQQWAQTTYADESNYELTERNVNGRLLNNMYAAVIRDLRASTEVAAVDQFLTAENKTNQQAIMDIVEIYTFHVVVDVFGDMPYSEALNIDDVTPKYDDDAAIYADLATRLDAAIGKMSGESALGANDLVYGGDVASWTKFANSLKLRLAIRIADSNDSKAKTMAEEAVAAGVFTSSADNFSLVYSNATPNTNPLWEDLVQSGRSDFVIANTLTDVMNTLEDPRRAHYFSDLDVDGVTALGGIYGGNNSYSAFSHPGASQKDPTWAGVLLSYSEVEFLLADAAERGYSVGGTAEDHYNAGITASIMYWGGSQADADAYIASPSVSYATAAGSWKEKIAMQKWLALYDQGFEAWSTYRLYDAPVFNLAENSGIPTPNRYIYPVTEYSLNEANVMSAGSAMGGDALSSKVFWDVN